MQEEWAKDPMWQGTAGVRSLRINHDSFNEGNPVKKRVGGAREGMQFSVDDPYSGQARGLDSYSDLGIASSTDQTFQKVRLTSLPNPNPNPNPGPNPNPDP